MKANQSTKLSQENVRELHADDMFRKSLRSCIFLGADHDGKSGINGDVFPAPKTPAVHRSVRPVSSAKVRPIAEESLPGHIAKHSQLLRVSGVPQRDQPLQGCRDTKASLSVSRPFKVLQVMIAPGRICILSLRNGSKGFSTERVSDTGRKPRKEGHHRDNQLPERIPGGRTGANSTDTAEVLLGIYLQRGGTRRECNWLGRVLLSVYS